MPKSATKVSSLELFECNIPATKVTAIGCAKRQKLCVKTLEKWHRTGVLDREAVISPNDVLACLRCRRCGQELKSAVFTSRREMEHLITKLEDLCLRCGKKPRKRSHFSNAHGKDILCKDCYRKWKKAGGLDVCRLCHKPLRPEEAKEYLRWVCPDCAHIVNHRFNFYWAPRSHLHQVQISLLREFGTEWFWQPTSGAEGTSHEA